MHAKINPHTIQQQNNTIYTICIFGTHQESWDYLQLQCALYINSEVSGIPLTMAVWFIKQV